MSILSIKIKYFLYLTVILIGTFGFINSVDAIWYDSNWQFRKKITIDEAKIDENLVNFPVAVILASSTNFDFTKARGDGYDVIFTKDDESTLLDFERERYSTTTGNAEFWVEIPSVASSTASTTFYMYYGNSGASDIASSTAAWDSNFKAVWHLKDLTTSTIKDSTANNHDGAKKGANEPAENVGQIAKCQDFDGTNDYISIPDSADFYYSGNFTIEFWLRLDDVGYNGDMYHQEDVTKAAPRAPIMIKVSTANKVRVDGSTDGTNWNIVGTTGAVALNQNTWYHIALVRNGTNYSSYINGTVDINVTDSDTPYNNAYPVYLGIGVNESTWSEPLHGRLDEYRITNGVARSAGWIVASYNSGNNSLLTYGSEEIPSVVAPSVQRRFFQTQ